jgi:hypothetical protein
MIGKSFAKNGQGLGAGGEMHDRTFLTVHLRFAQINMYYNKDILYIYEDNDPIKVINKELELLKLNKENRYLPKRNFHGKNECFSKVEYD